jgi:hypothetical protein
MWYVVDSMSRANGQLTDEYMAFIAAAAIVLLVVRVDKQKVIVTHFGLTAENVFVESTFSKGMYVTFPLPEHLRDCRVSRIHHRAFGCRACPPTTQSHREHTDIDR